MAAAVVLAAVLAGVAAPAAPAAAATQPVGTIDTVAGGLGQGRATNVGNHLQGGLMVDGGHLYVGDLKIAMVRDLDLGTGLQTPMPTTFLGSNVVTTIRDGNGNFYLYMGGSTGSQGVTEPFARYQCQVVKMAPGGATTVVAGNGTCGYSGDGGPATAAQLGSDGGTRLAFDPAGDLYIADLPNNRVRKVDASGVITTVVGTGTVGYSGDGGAATKANLAFPGAMVFDPAGNLYLADGGNNLVRRVDAATRVITTVAGRDGGCSPSSNFNGDGVATEHNLGCPKGLALDNARRYLFISDFINHRVRRVDLAASPPTMVTVAGDGSSNAGRTGGRSSIGDGGPGTSASVRFPSHLAFDAATGNLYISDDGYVRVRRLDPAGVITTAAGNGFSSFGGDGGPATSAQLNDELVGVASDGAGNVFVSDAGNFVVRRIDPAGVVTTVAGIGTGVGPTGTGTSGLSPDGGAATATPLQGLRGVAADDSGLYISTTGEFDCRIRRVANGVISTVAGSQGAPFASSCGNSGDGGPATSAKIARGGLALDGARHLYLGSDCSVRRIDLAASPPTISTVAGNGTCGNSGDGGPAILAQVDGADSVAVDGAGNLYLAASIGCVVRKVNTAGIISTVAGSPSCGNRSTWTGPFGDGGPATSAFVLPNGLAVDRAGANLYIADVGTARVRGVDLSSGIISTVAGSSPGFSGDGGPATSAQLRGQGLALDGAGGLYIGDSGNRRLRKVVAVLPPQPVLGSASGTTVRMSVDSTGAQGGGPSGGASTSADGRYVAFTSAASNLVSGDTNGVADIFVRDQVSGITSRLSVSSPGVQANGASAHPSISADGRYVAFDSTATNLAFADTNGASDVFVRDRVAGTTTRVSVNSAGAQATGGGSADPAISANGMVVAFSSTAPNLVAGDTNGAADVFVRDMATGATTRVSVNSAGAQATGPSTAPALSGNGNVVAFSSDAADVVGGDTNGAADVFVRDMATGATTRVSVNSGGVQATGSSTDPSLNSDGTVVAFSSAATNVVGGDTNGVSDVFVANRTTRAVTRASVGAGGAQFDNRSATAPSLSADGRRVAFESSVTGFLGAVSQDIVVHDNVAGTTTQWSIGAGGAQANGHSSAPAISADGAMVAFASYAPNLVGGDTNAATDVFARYVTLPTPTPVAALAGPGEAGTTTRSSVGVNGAQATGAGPGDRPVSSTSGDGRYVAFESAATNLVPGDTNGVADVFVADRVAGTTTRVSVGTKNFLGVSVQANGPSAHPSISADGRYVAFESRASNLVPLDANNKADIFVRDLVKGTTARLSVDKGGVEARGGDSLNPAISVNATKVVVAFSSAATNLVAGDTNSATEVFVRQVSTANLSAGGTLRVTGCVQAVAQLTGGRPTYFPTPAVSGDANTVAFESDAPNLVAGDTNGVADIFVYRPGRGCARVSVDNSFGQPNGPSSAPALNYDGTVVAFTSAATNLVAGDTNGVAEVFVRNLATAVTTRVSVAGPGTQANGGSDHPSLSADGRYVAFDSTASNLVGGDTGFTDVFVHDNTTGATGRWSIAAGGAAPNGDSVLPSISANARVVVFASTASNLVAADTNAAPDTFARQRG